MTRAEVARFLGIDQHYVEPSTPAEIRAVYAGPLSPDALDVALQPTGEDGRAVQFWKVGGLHYLDDPTFAGSPVLMAHLRYDDEIGLHVSEDAITPDMVEGDPLNALFLALNHYISTGDHVGEGVAVPEGDTLQIGIPYAPTSPEDRGNWERLQARLEQIAGEHSLPIRITHAGNAGRFTLMQVTIARSDMPRLTTLLRAQPGPQGWGTEYATLKRHGLL